MARRARLQPPHELAEGRGAATQAADRHVASEACWVEAEGGGGEGGGGMRLLVGREGEVELPGHVGSGEAAADAHECHGAGGTIAR